MTIGAKTDVVRYDGANTWSDVTVNYGLCSNPAVVVPSNGVDSAYVTRPIGETWSGADIPGYRQRIKSGIASTNPFYKTWTKYEVTPGSGGHVRADRQNVCGGLRTTRLRQEAWYYSVAPDMPSGTPTHSSTAELLSAQQFIRRARGRLAEAQALVSVGEARESVRMALSARRAVLDKLRAFQRTAIKNTRGIKNVTGRKKAVANAWLEYSFGWSPLIGDSVNLANAAARSIVGSTHPRRVSGMTEHSTVIEEGDGYNWHLGTGSTNARQRLIATTRCRYFGALRWETGAAGDFKSSFGLTMDNWLPSIWELIPWSFAIDYFTGFGDFLSSITFPVSKFLYYGRSRKSTLTRERYNGKNLAVDVNTLTATRRYWATPGTSRAIKGVFERDIPPMIVRLPRLRVPGYKEAYINLGALVALRNNNRI